MLRTLLLIAAFLACLLSAAPARAHPADEANVYHYLWFEPRQGVLELQHATIVGGLLTQAVWPEIDTDGDGAVSESEAERHAGMLTRQISLRVAGKPVQWQLSSRTYPGKEEFFGRSMAAITLRLRARIPKTPVEVSVRDETFIHFTGVFPQPVVKPTGTGASGPRVSEDGRLTEFDVGPGAGAGTTGVAAAPAEDSGKPDLGNAPIFPDRGKIVYAPPGDGSHAETSALKDFLHRPLSPLLILIALGAALIAGMAHALSPGHGKTMVAAYLVGTRGTVRDAVVLGIVVTITHTAGVYLLGFLCLWLTRQIRAEVVGHWLSLTSGLLVLGMGFWLFQRGLLAYYGVKPMPGHTHGPGGHSHGHSHSHEHHSHAHHGDDPGSEHRPPHDAPLDSYRDTPSPERGLEQKGLIWLGVAGGIVPCFDALAVLIAAVNLRRIELGLGLIAAFSVGMALVLVAIGILFVKAKALMQRFTGEAKWVKVLPAVSGAILALLGAWLTFQSLVQAGVLKT